MTLFPHQLEAAEFLAARRTAGLFDEQGLGKTAAAITAADKVGATRILVVVPAVVLHNWRREIQQWSSGEVQLIANGKTPVSPSARWVIVTHSLLAKPAVLKGICSVSWDVLIVDEAHAFKTPTAQRTKALYWSVVRSCKRTWILTGTPMPNNPSELWTHLQALCPERIRFQGRTARFKEFRSAYCILQPIPFGPAGAVKVVGARNTDDLKLRLRGWSLRRRKDTVLDLPERRWATSVVTPDTVPAELRKLEAQLGLAGASPEELLAALRDSEHFSTWRRLCGLAKADAAADLLHAELEDGALPQVVVFCHHVEVAARLVERLAEFGVVRITGDVSAAGRQQAVEQFQAGKARVAVCQIVAGGVGITLTAASDLVFVEQSWVPGENAQAADRVHRIGQKKSVLVRTLLLANSIDELIGEALARKSAMIRAVLA